MDEGRDKIVKLAVPTGTEPVSDLVATLEGLLERAKSGELRALAYGTVDGAKCDTTGTGWVGGYGTRMPLSASILMLHDRYAQALRSGD